MPEDSRPPPLAEPALDIREAITPDIDELTKLEGAAFRSDRLSRRSLTRLLQSPTAHLLVGRIGGRLAGYALVLTRHGTPFARLYSLAVAPDNLRRGIGGKLLEAAEAAARAAGAEGLRLEVRADNDAAIGLYARRGYRRIGQREAYYEDGGDALRLQRDFTPLRTQESQPASLGRAA
jgi:ribosomal protein S18 acetylase RimI-like enzyme